MKRAALIALLFVGCCSSGRLQYERTLGRAEGHRECLEFYADAFNDIVEYISDSTADTVRDTVYIIRPEVW